MGAHLASWARRGLARGRSLLASLDRRSLRVVVPAVTALALLPFLLPLVPLEIKEPLFGDSIVYEYTGWCLRHGLKLYRDFGMMDGPFIHFLMAAMQGLAGVTDRGFRKVDLGLHAGGSAAIGALLAPTAGLKRPGRVVSRLSWAALASTVWLAWYFTLSWDTTTEREVYYSLFGALGMVLLYVSRDLQPKGAKAAIFIGAFIVTSQVFGKPTGIMYPAAGSLCVLLQDAKAATTLRLRLRTFVAGVGACVLTVLLAMAIWGSFSGYWLWCVTIPVRENPFLWRGDWFRLFLVGYDPIRQTALLSLVSGVAAVACGLLPARSLGFALLPLVAYMGFCLQGRGLAYQAVPVEAGGMALSLVFLSAMWPRLGSSAWLGWRGMLAMALVTGFAYHAFENIEGSPYRWSGDKTHWDAPCSHHFADTEREVGLYVKAHTRPTDSGFACCGNSHVILLFAERPTASPFFHGVWLDSVDLISHSQIQPNAVELEALKGLQARVRNLACAAVERNKPGWMVFGKWAPTPESPNLDQVYGICPKLRDMMASDYQESTVIGDFHVYLRKPAS